MVTLFKIVLMTLLLVFFSGCAYDPAYQYGSSGNYYGSSGYSSPGYSSYGNGYRNGYYNSGSRGYGYNNRGYGFGRYCPDDD
ncbi:hypothetical protein MCAMS1_00530 [biofilm metagenome]